MQVDSNEKTTPKIAEHSAEEGSAQGDQGVTQMSSLFNDMGWLVPTATAPTKRPLQPMGMLVLYINGATKRLYVYDIVGNAWHYTALT